MTPLQFWILWLTIILCALAILFETAHNEWLLFELNYVHNETFRQWWLGSWKLSDEQAKKDCIETCIREQCRGPLHNVQCDDYAKLAKKICIDKC